MYVKMDKLDALIAYTEKQKPDLFNMKHWFSKPGLPNEKAKVPRKITDEGCGTPACIGGNAVIVQQLILAKNRGKKIIKLEPVSVYKIYGTARKWLGLSKEQADALFLPHYVEDLLKYSDMTKRRAIQVLKYIKKYPECSGFDIIKEWHRVTKATFVLDKNRIEHYFDDMYH